MERSTPVIFVGHELAPEDGFTFICTERGVVREFGSIAQAQKHLDTFMPPTQRQLWGIYVLAEVVPATWKDDDGA